MQTKQFLEVPFFLVCSSLTVYFVRLQFLSFISNEDVASISYRHFNKEGRDEYPEFTLCLGSRHFYRIYKKGYFEKESINDSGFAPQTNKKYQRNSISKGAYPVVDPLKFDYISQAIQPWGKPKALIVKFIDPYQICLSNNVSFQRDVKFTTDVILLNASLLLETFNHLHVFFNKRNQFFRTIARPKRKIYKDWFEGSPKYVFDVVDVEVLRGREDSPTPCNGSLTNEDAYVRDVIVDRFKCVPAYWKELRLTLESGLELPICNEEQYRNVSSLLSSLADRFGTTDEIYRPPCDTMRISVAVMKGGSNKPNSIKLEFNYHQNSYKDIINKRGFTSEDLLGQVGGFVGT